VNLKNTAGVVGCFCAALLLVACKTPAPPAEAEGTILYVGPAMADCVGVGPMTCLLVKDAHGDDYRMFYDPIEGFDYIPGYEYELRIEVTKRENVPADASALVYTLIEVVGKKKAGLAIDSTAWELSSYLSVSGTMDPRVEKSIVNMKIADGKVTGNAGANRFFGGCEVDGSSVRISATGSTMMMGTPEVMAQENQFLKLLQDSVDYLIVGEELRLRTGDGKVVLTLVPAIEPGLTANVWQATGVNNGKGGVASILAGSEITAVFDADGTLSGNAGCNDYSGKYEEEGEMLKIGPVGQTRKLSNHPEGIMEQEANYLQALEQVSKYRIDGKVLELRSERGSLQVSFIQQEQE
jgi:heat shock protein HslJ